MKLGPYTAKYSASVGRLHLAARGTQGLPNYDAHHAASSETPCLLMARTAESRSADQWHRLSHEALDHAHCKRHIAIKGFFRLKAFCKPTPAQKTKFGHAYACFLMALSHDCCI